MSDDPRMTYDEERRRGFCSCGSFATYGVSRPEFAVKARRHLAWHAEKAKRAGERVAPAEPIDALNVAYENRFADTAEQIANLPTIEEPHD